MCHHPKRFSEDCVDFNMHEEKEIETERSGSSEIPNYLNELADYARRQVEELLPVIKKYNDYSEEQIEELRTHLMAMFLEGAGWQKEKMMKEAVDAIVEDWNTDPEPEITIPLNPEEFTCGDKVRVIIIPNTDEK